MRGRWAYRDDVAISELNGRVGQNPREQAELHQALERLLSLFDQRDLAREMTGFLLQLQPELRRGANDEGYDEQLFEETSSSCEANLGAIFAGLRASQDPTEIGLPGPADAWARSMARRGAGLPAALRAYRLGHGWLWRRWQAEINAADFDDATRGKLLEHSSGFMFTYIDTASALVADAYAAERERWVRSAAAMRAEAVRTLLDGKPVDADAVSRSLKYELRRTHTALILWTDGPAEEESDPLEAAAIALAGQLGCREPLLVPTGRGLLWAWCATHEAADRETFEALALEPGSRLRVAVGQGAGGIDGFVRSHEEAEQARRIAQLSGRAPGTVVTYARVAFASLVCADRDRAARFVADELGALAANDDATSRLRATLAIFLDEGASHVRAARRLHIHQNTVAYRVHRAEELLGRQVSVRRQELEAALLIARVLGTEDPVPADAA